MPLRERNRLAARREIQQTGLRLFLEQGFDATTVDEIAARVGVSRSTVFRHFPTKEDIVLDDIAERGVLVRSALERRPADEPAFEALAAALEVLVEHTPRAETLALSRMLRATASLRARQAEKHRRWLDLLVPETRRRLGVDPARTDDPRAHALVACVLTCLDVANEMWTANDGEGDQVAVLRATLSAMRA